MLATARRHEISTLYHSLSWYTYTRVDCIGLYHCWQWYNLFIYNIYNVQSEIIIFAWCDCY